MACWRLQQWLGKRTQVSEGPVLTLCHAVSYVPRRQQTLMFGKPTASWLDAQRGVNKRGDASPQIYKPFASGASVLCISFV